MQERGPAFPTERVRAASRWPASLAAAVLAIVMALALIKPWSAATLAKPVPAIVAALPSATAEQAAATASPAPPTSAAPPRPSPSPANLRRQCLDPALWRLLTIERSGTLQGRSLLPISLVAADGPADPAIVPQVVRTGTLLALGYCAPVAIHADLAATEAQVRIWQALGAGAPQPLSGFRVMDAALAGVGEVYLLRDDGTHDPVSGTTSAWPAGRYVYELPPDAAGGVPGWFAFTFISSAPSEPGTAPSGEPGTAPSGAPSAPPGPTP